MWKHRCLPSTSGAAIRREDSDASPCRPPIGPFAKKGRGSARRHVLLRAVRSGYGVIAAGTDGTLAATSSHLDVPGSC